MKQTSVKHNFVMNVILTVSSFLFPLLTFPYVTRILQPAGMGKVTLATSVISYFSMFAQLGTPTYGIRACARIRDDRELLTKTVHELLGINLSMTVFSYVLLIIVLLFSPRMQKEKSLYLLISISIFLNTIGMEWLYKALEQYTYITLRSMIFKFIAFITTFLLIHTERDYLIYGGLTIFASSASNLLNFINAKKIISLRRPIDCNWKQHLRPIMIFFTLSCAATIYTNLDAIMLGFMTTDVDVGIYNAAVKVKTVLVGFVTALGAVLLPRSSYYIEHKEDEKFRVITEKAARFVVLTAVPLMIYFVLFAGETIIFLSGEAYNEAIPAMRIIMPTVLFIGLSNVMGIQVLVPLGREKVVLRSEIAGALVDLVLNLFLIPCWRATGAAVGTLVAEMTVLLVQYEALRDDIQRKDQKLFWKKMLIALMLAGGLCLPMKVLKLDHFVTLMLSSMCFFTVYTGFLLWRKEELLAEVTNRIVR